MKRFLIFVILNFLVIFTVMAQPKDACFYLQTASNAYCENNFKKMVKPLSAFLEKYPSHALEEEALYARAFAYYKMKKNKAAIADFKNLLSLENYNVTDSFGMHFFDCNLLINQCRNILIPEMLINLQHEGAIILFEIYFASKKWDEARDYLYAAKERYRLWHGCGTGDLDADMRLATLHSRLLNAQNKKDSALLVLLPYTLEAAAFPMQYYKALITEANKLLKEQFSQVEIEELLWQAVESLYYSSHESHRHGESRIYYIRMLDVIIKVSPDYLFQHNYNEYQVKDYIKNTEFFRLLSLSTTE